jgi:hypothetical protein
MKPRVTDVSGTVYCILKFKAKGKNWRVLVFGAREELT